MTLIIRDAKLEEQINDHCQCVGIHETTRQRLLHYYQSIFQRHYEIYCHDKQSRKLYDFLDYEVMIDQIQPMTPNLTIVRPDIVNEHRQEKAALSIGKVGEYCYYER